MSSASPSCPARLTGRLLRRSRRARAAVLSCTLLSCAILSTSCIRTVDLGTVEVARDIRTESSVRSASNLPQSFAIAIPARAAGECPIRLRDDVVGAVLDLQRAMQLPVQDSAGSRYEAFGDYRATPAGFYGDTEPEDGLRIDCTRLRALGIVRLGG
jgi:hypothetical protein